MLSWAVCVGTIIPGLLASSGTGAYEVDGVVELGLRSVPVAEPLRRRDNGDIDVDLNNQNTYYQVTLGFGTPQQQIQLTLDTGSSDTWVPADGFHYDSSSSFTRNSSGPDLKITYGDNAQASGFWGTDTIQFGQGLTLENANIGIADHTTGNAKAILGLGLIDGESTVSRVSDGGTLAPTYFNIPAQLKAQGKIKRTSYSLWLNSRESNKGQLLFGGVDHDKYEGDSIGLVPIVNDETVSASNNPTTLSVMLHGVAVGTEHYDTSVAVLLDSGTTLSYLPSELADAVAKSLNANWDDGSDMYKVPCDIQGSLTFNISGISIPVALKDTLISQSNGQCNLGISKNPTAEKYILGDSFLRSVYAVFDLESMQVGLAPSSVNATSSNVEVIDSGVPSATSAKLYSATATSTSINSYSLAPTQSGSLPTTTSTSSGSDTATTILSQSKSQHSSDSTSESNSQSNTQSSSPKSLASSQTSSESQNGRSIATSSQSATSGFGGTTNSASSSTAHVTTSNTGSAQKEGSGGSSGTPVLRVPWVLLAITTVIVQAIV